MRNRFLMGVSLALVALVAVSCSDNDRVLGPLGIPANFANGTSQECAVVDFNTFTHGDAITSVSLFSPAVVLSVAGATAYDTELWDNTGNPPPNSTHNDTQKNILCGDCDGIMPVVAASNFARDGDASGGGTITFTGFPGDYTWTIPSYAAVDDDGSGQTITLFIDGSEVGASSGQGNASVEIVEPRVQPITLEARFVLEGSGGIDNIEICREPEPEGVGRMTGGGGYIGMTGTNGESVKVTHGFTVHCDVFLTNNLEINWNGNKWHIEKETFDPGYPICTDEPGVNPEPPPAPFDTFEGRTTGKLNGEDGSPIWFMLQDAGEPGGKNDKGGIMIWDVGADPSTDAPILTVEFDFLEHGNLQAHYDQPHGNKP